jgi:hypothetical protein
MTPPELKVLREDFCSQEAADNAIGWVQSHRPELIDNLLMEEYGRQHSCSEAAWEIVEIPTTLIGGMDLICRPYPPSAPRRRTFGDSAARHASSVLVWRARRRCSGA